MKTQTSTKTQATLTTSAVVEWPVLRILTGYWCRANGYPDRMPMSLGANGHIYDVSVDDENITVAIRRNVAVHSQAMDNALRISKILAVAARNATGLKDNLTHHERQSTPDARAIETLRAKLKAATAERDRLTAEYERLKSESVQPVETFTLPMSIFREEGLRI